MERSFSGDEVSRIRFQASLLEAVGQAVVATDMRGKIVYWNTAAERMYGWLSEEVTGHAADEVLVSGELRERAAEIMVALGRGNSWSGEFTVMHRNGDPLSVLVSDTPVYGEEGKMIGIVGVSTDITGRKRMEEALRESEERFRELHDATFEGIFIHDGEKILEANEALAAMSGYEKHDLVGRPGLSFVTPESRDLVRRHVWAGSGEPYEVVGVRKDGAHLDLEVRGRKFVYRGRGVRLVSVRDVTERKRAEAALKESEERYKTIARATNDVIWEVDLATEELKWIGDVQRIFGYSPDEMEAGSWWEERVHPEDRERAVSGIERMMQGGGDSWSDEYRFRFGDGSYGTVVDRAFPIRDENGVPVRLIGSMLDVTRRREAEETLKESEERFRTLTDAALEALVISERVNDETGGILGVNRAFKEIFGYESEEFADKGVRDVIAPESLDLVEENISSEYAGIYEAVGIRKDGTRLDLEIRGQTIDYQGRRVRISALRDITERKRAEGRLRILAEASRAFAEAGTEFQTLLDTISHTVAENFGDFCGVWTLSGDGQTVGPTAYHHPDPAIISIFRELMSHPMRVGEGLTGRVMQTGEPIVIPVVDPEQLAAMAQPEHRPYMERISIHGVLVVPMRVHGEMVGGLNLARTRPGKPYTEQDRELAEDLAERAGLAIDNALLYRAAEEEISGRKRMEDALRKSEEEYRELFENHPQPMWVHDTGTLEFLAVNEAAVSHYGYSRGEFLSMTIMDISLAEESDRLREIMRTISEGPRYTSEWRHRKKDGMVFDVEISSHGTDFDGRPARIVQAVDITERKLLEEQLAHQAFHDSLTGLPNRALFANRLEHALAGIRRSESIVAVLFADLDNFKQVNDSLGHETGDQLLVAVGERLRACLRPEDTLARFGGDEFAILLDDVENPTDVARVANRVAEEFREPIGLGGREVFVSVSIGISLEDSEDALPEIVLRNADTAMYQAKERDGVSHEVFEPGMYARVLDRLELENDLRRALDQGEFRVQYQPLVDLRSGGIVGMEALVRWENPERGLIFPAEFIPLAEETGLIVPLGRRVLEEACRQTRAWHSEHPEAAHLEVGVNLSLRHFQNPGLVEEVADALRNSGLDPHYLWLEITESVAMKDAERTAAVLRELKKLGVQLAIDDFGKGHSSLTYLIKRFQMDILKIDRSFVAELPRDTDYETIVAGITGIARSLNLRVVAEGIETAEQHAQVRNMGCDTAQGFYFSRPVPSEEASALLAAGTHW